MSYTPMQGKAMKTKSGTFISAGTIARGELACERQLEIVGTLEGSASALERVIVRNNATLKGDIETSELLIERGAKVTGQLRVFPPAKEWSKWSRLWQR
jgi:cytoskeletal protein CcmA (bactofilin family)